MLTRQLQRLLPSPRRFHDIARTQELLSGHPGLSRCVVYKEIDAAEAEVDVMALPRKKRGEFVPPTADELRAFAREGGFTGVINSVKFMTTAPRSHFPQTSSQLADLLMRHIFDQADADADGRVTHAEVTRFVGGHGVAPADEALRSLLLELPPLLTLEDFARVLLETRLLTVPPVGESRGECSRPSVHVVASMVPIASAAMFEHADIDGDGLISPSEAHRLLQAYDIPDTDSKFARYDADASGMIDRREFEALLLGEGLVLEQEGQTPKPATPSAAR